MHGVRPGALLLLAVVATFDGRPAVGLSAVPEGAGQASRGGPGPDTRLPVARDLLEAQWPASWIAAPGAPAREPGVQHFRRTFDLATVPDRLLVHVTAGARS